MILNRKLNYINNRENLSNILKQKIMKLYRKNYSNCRKNQMMIYKYFLNLRKAFYSIQNYFKPKLKKKLNLFYIKII